jgi:hypothetical protein
MPVLQKESNISPYTIRKKVVGSIPIVETLCCVWSNPPELGAETESPFSRGKAVLLQGIRSIGKGCKGGASVRVYTSVYTEN